MTEWDLEHEQALTRGRLYGLSDKHTHTHTQE